MALYLFIIITYFCSSVTFVYVLDFSNRVLAFEGKGGVKLYYEYFVEFLE